MRILRDKSGTSGVEFALTVPVVLLLFLGAVTVFDLYRTYWQVTHATSVVSDVVTRETTINKAYVDRVYAIYTNLFNSPTAPKALRISSLKKIGATFVVQWTTQRGDTRLLPPQAIDASNFPDIADSDSIIYVEGVTVKSAATRFIGFASMTFAQNAYARPRFINAIALTN